MKKQVLFIQGAGEGAHDEWDDKLVDSLKRKLGTGYEIRYPRMRNEADPRYAPWRDMLVREIAALDDGAIVIGHSIGGMFLVHALADEQPRRKLAGVFLIAAPFAGPGGWQADEDIDAGADLGSLLPAHTPVFLYHGSADDIVPPSHADLYQAAISQATIKHLRGRDHQLNNDLTEVAEDILGLA